MATQSETPKVKHHWWKSILIGLLVAYLIGRWVVPTPQPSDDVTFDAEKQLRSAANPTETDVFEFRSKTIWVPKRFGATRNEKGEVNIEAYPLDMISSSSSRMVRMRTDPNISFSRYNYHRDRDTSLNGAAALEFWRQSSGNANPEWDRETELFRFDSENVRYYYSESYSSPTAGPFFIICQTGTYSLRPSFVCNVGYLVHSFIFLEYNFVLHEGQRPYGWKALDLAIRRFSYAAVWYDGEISSIPANEGYDHEGRRLANMGLVTLQFPTRQGTHSFARPGSANFLRADICVDEDTHISDCPRLTDKIRIILQATETRPMPNDAEEMLDRVTRSLDVGPIPTTNSNVDEYRYSEESVSRTFVLRELDASGRFPTVYCSSWCRSRFIATPGLQVTYDFEPVYQDEWPRINAAVRETIEELISSPAE